MPGRPAVGRPADRAIAAGGAVHDVSLAGGLFMRILFTGATGVIGRETVPLLTRAGHLVTAVFRSRDDGRWLESTGALAITLDLFDRSAVEAAVTGADAVVHFATAIPPAARMKHRDAWLLNDRLRAEATAGLVDAAIRHGVARFVQQSVTLVYADGAESWLDETSAIGPPWDALDSALAAEQHVARFTAAGGTGIVLRLSRLYGPGRTSAELVAGVMGRRVPIVGDGRNYVSSLFVTDAATAVAAALEASSGTYNVTDDDPVPAAAYTESLARELGAPAPRRVPVWTARLAAGGAVGLSTVSQRVGHDRFTEETGWVPAVSSVRRGWRRVAADAAKGH